MNKRKSYDVAFKLRAVDSAEKGSREAASRHNCLYRPELKIIDGAGYTYTHAITGINLIKS